MKKILSIIEMVMIIIGIFFIIYLITGGISLFIKKFNEESVYYIYCSAEKQTCKIYNQEYKKFVFNWIDSVYYDEVEILTEK